MTNYRIIQNVDGQLISNHVTEENLGAWCDVRGFKIIGVNTNPRQRAELQGQPKISGLLGPMWDGEGVIRYEDQGSYDRLSA